MANDDYEGFLSQKQKAARKREQKLKDKENRKKQQKSFKKPKSTDMEEEFLEKYPHQIYNIDKE